MAEMPTEILQRSQWGFYSWWVGKPDEPFPAAFVQMALAMGAELPDYFRKAQFITAGQIITAKGAAAIYEGEAFPWTSSVPMVALDGRLVKFVVERWGLTIQSRFGELQALAELADTNDVYMPIVYGHNKMLDEHLYNLSVMHTLARGALNAGVPDLGDGETPVFVMVPATVLEDWAIMLIETAAFLEDAQASLEAGEPVGMVQTLESEAQAESRGRVRGPVLVGIAAIGLTVFGMFMVVRTGRVRSGTQVQQDIA